MTVKKLLRSLKKAEKIALVFLVILLLYSGYEIARAFYVQNTEPLPVQGGIYVEGAVGNVESINPLFLRQGSVAYDISQLIFSGLSKYDSSTGEIVGDLANFKVSSNGKEYTFVIRENAKWHDGEPVTANDVLFTFNDIIKNPEFKGAILNYNDYSGIKVIKIDNRTVQFLLEKPDSFFLVKTMVGILPRHALENEPVAFLESSPFNFAPIGSGPYKLSAVNMMPTHTEYSLVAFEDYYDEIPNIETILYKVFPSFKDLKKKISELDGIRTVPQNESAEISSRERFIVERFHLPQYVAIFINNESKKLENAKTRLALQLGTDKESLVEQIAQHEIIDTPLLEIDQDNWINQYSISRANGALFDTQWQLPEDVKEALEQRSDQEESGQAEAQETATAEVTNITSPNEGKDLKTTKETITITGTAPNDAQAIMVNEYELQKFVPGDSGWSYIASTRFDNLTAGKNVYEVYAVNFDGEKELLDAITIEYTSAETEEQETEEKIEEENQKAEDLPVRVNEEDETLTLNLITTAKPEIYAEVARIIQEQWRKIGVEVNIDILEAGGFQQKLNERDYDLLIFGQNLGYNLDAYPYWHSSQAKKDGLNLSQFKNFVADSLLEKARLEDEEARKDTLSQLQEIISNEVPAVFLYSPTYFTAVSRDVQHPPFKELATISDRLANISQWHAAVKRRFKADSNLLTFFPWIIKQF
jgi:ABC-type transport system substrate-binding protein